MQTGSPQLRIRNDGFPLAKSSDAPYESSIFALSEALQINKHLTWLDLSYFKIYERGAVSFAEALQNNASIEVLILKACFSESEMQNPFKLIAKALKVNTSIYSLDLSDNDFVVPSLTELAGALSYNKSICFLEVDGFYISGVDQKGLLQNLIERNAPQRLRLQRNWSRIAALIYFVRLHSDNALKYSISPLIPSILEMVEIPEHMEYLDFPERLTNLEQFMNSKYFKHEEKGMVLQDLPKTQKTDDEKQVNGFTETKKSFEDLNIGQQIAQLNSSFESLNIRSSLSSSSSSSSASATSSTTAAPYTVAFSGFSSLSSSSSPSNNFNNTGLNQAALAEFSGLSDNLQPNSFEEGVKNKNPQTK